MLNHAHTTHTRAHLISIKFVAAYKITRGGGDRFDYNPCYLRDNLVNINIIITQTTRTARIRDRLHYHCVDFIVFVFIVEIIDSSTPHALNHLFIGFHEFRCNAYYIYNGHTPFVISVCKYRRDIFIRDFLHFFFFF